MADDSKPQEEDCSMRAARALAEMNCCARCCLRLLGERNISLYENSHEADVKITCIACLGILEKSNENVYIDKMQSSIKAAGHQFENFMFTISLPHSIILRQHSISLFLQENYSSIFDKKELNENPTVKDVFKWVYGPTLEKSLQVDYKPLSPFKISLAFTHKDGERELEFLIEPPKSRLRQRRKRQKYNPEEGTATAAGVKRALAELTTVDQLKGVVDCPPKSPQSPSELSEITCAHDSIYIAGLSSSIKFQSHLKLSFFN
ncbi:tRNA pseudouridine synthase Pus10-like, partial [Oculina patagonica]